MSEALGILLKGGHIAREDSPVLEASDVLLVNGVIQTIGPDQVPGTGVEVWDAEGCVIMPSMCDLHVHAREPGQEHKETIATTARAAINGGVTTLMLMPNTVPAIDTGGMVRMVLESASRTPITIHTTGAITVGREGKELAAIAGMHAQGVRMLTDDGAPVSNSQVLRLAMEYARDFDLILASHCETMEMSHGGSMNEGLTAYQLGLRGIPPESEEICIDRDARLARFTGARLHIQHVSSKEGMETIRRYKEQGVRITCEVAPHHLMFCDEDIGDYDTHYKMNPPLRTRKDNEALLQGLIDGHFDIIATDHAPHTAVEKNQDFAAAPFGITGLDTAVTSLYHHYVKKTIFGWDLVVKRYSAEPHRLMGWPVPQVVEGQSANLLVFDTRATSVFSAAFMKSKSKNTPFLDRELDGKVRGVWHKGRCLLWRGGNGPLIEP